MNNQMIHILIVEDDSQIRNYLSYTLKNEGYHYTSLATATSAIHRLLSEPYDVMLLDLGLPDMDGMDVIMKVREFSDIPIIVISARDQDSEKAKALDLGADDYLTKPFSSKEFLARLRVCLRHLFRSVNQQTKNILENKELKIDFEKHCVYKKGEEIHLTPMEYSLMSLFFKNQGKILTTNYIIKEIYGPGYGKDTQALRALTASLRRKIEKNSATPEYILTEIGVGYRMKEN